MKGRGRVLIQFMDLKLRKSELFLLSWWIYVLWGFCFVTGVVSDIIHTTAARRSNMVRTQSHAINKVLKRIVLLFVFNV